MKAAVLNEFGSPLEVTTLPDLVLGTGEIIVDVVAAHVLSYTGEVLRGERNYTLELPLAPGTAAVGRVRATGPDSTRLRPGDWVLCDITVRSRDSLQAPDIVLQGWSARGPGGRQLMRHYRHGAFASQMMIPTENAIPLGPLDEADAGRWCALDLLLVPFGGFTAVDLRPGETVLDLGSGGGIDVLLSGRRVGPSGKAYGLDMTGEMLELARANAAEAGAANVEFLEGHIEAIPLPDNAVDVIISNCVINLSGDKPAVFAESFRVLRPGGRFGVSDILADDELTEAERLERERPVGCLAGVLSFTEYRDGLARAGFTGITITPTHEVTEGLQSAIIQAVRP